MPLARHFLWAFFLGLIAFPCARAAEAPLVAPGIKAEKLEFSLHAKTGFTLLSPAQTKVTFTNTLDPAASAENRVLNNGSGVAAGDFDNDGRVDLFFSSLNNGNRLFRNLGNWTFE